MANRVVPTPPDADNPAGSFTLAACNDWRVGVRRFHVGTGHLEPTHDAGYTTAGSLVLPQLSINPLLPGGSPYTRLGGIAIDLTSMPNLDNFKALVRVIDRVDHAILPLTDSEESA